MSVPPVAQGVKVTIYSTFVLPLLIIQASVHLPSWVGSGCETIRVLTKRRPAGRYGFPVRPLSNISLHNLYSSHLTSRCGAGVRDGHTPSSGWLLLFAVFLKIAIEIAIGIDARKGKVLIVPVPVHESFFPIKSVV